MSTVVVGVMGPGEGAAEMDMRLAFEMGRLIAHQGWVLVTGGREAGVMEAASRGAKEAGGLVVGILPGITDEGMSTAVDIPIVTGMREARNLVNVLTCKVLFFVGMNAGTASELALALKYHRPAVLVRQRDEVIRFCGAINGRVEVAVDAESALAAARRLLAFPPHGCTDC